MPANIMSAAAGADAISTGTMFLKQDWLRRASPRQALRAENDSATRRVAGQLLAVEQAAMAVACSPLLNNLPLAIVLEPVITLAVAPAVVIEDGVPNLVYIFSRTGTTTSDLIINYDIAGSADAADYTGATPGTGKTIRFAAGFATASLTIDPKADNSAESDETVVLTLAAGTGYTIGTTAAVVGTISND
ncbi:MAG: hypothetical protein WAM11_04070, partial [Cyanobium sp.]